MRITPKKMSKLDGRVCFICGKFLLNHSNDDLAYIRVHTGKTMRARPDKYYLFACPNCSKIAHKRCWYNVGEEKHRKGWFGKEWQLKCPDCGHILSERREDRVDWKKGYQIPGYPDEELLELHKADILTWKAGALFGRLGQAIGSFFKSVGLGSLSDPERSSIARAAGRIGKTIQDVAQEVFKLDIPKEKRKELEELRCQNCDAPLPLPGEFEDAIVCEHCGTAHLL